LRKLLPIFNVYPIRKAILFGSYAKENATELSDVDLVIDSEGKIRGIDFFGILEEIVETGIIIYERVIHI